MDEKLLNLVKDGRNCTDVECYACGSVIFRPQAARFIHKDTQLPLIENRSSDEAETKRDQIQGCWVVDDMYAFENIGFSHLVDQTKYLTCADCEIGPIGWHDVRNPKEFFIALSRVNHKI